MGLSLSRIYSSLSSLAFWGKDKEVRILMVGLDSAGKVGRENVGLWGCVRVEVEVEIEVGLSKLCVV
jgi:hypothetical protein